LKAPCDQWIEEAGGFYFMMIFNFPIDPVPKGRPRFSRGKVYTPPKTKEFEKLVRKMASEQYRNGPLRDAVSMTVVFIIKKPKSVKREYPTVKSDLDNYIKSLCDALNGIAFVDDSQIIEINASKKYGPVGGIFVDIESYLHH
jgi:Holliday junction resolvase RusA-like endonuclease